MNALFEISNYQDKLVDLFILMFGLAIVVGIIKIIIWIIKSSRGTPPSEDSF